MYRLPGRMRGAHHTVFLPLQVDHRTSEGGLMRFSSFVALMVLALVLALNIAATSRFPNIIPLPDGFFPEGIATGRGTTFYAGSLVDGAIYSGDLRTGKGSILVEGETGQIAVGMKVDERSNYLFVAGGFGEARVYDAGTGELVGEYDLNGLSFPSTFVNDVIVTRDAAYFTDSFRPVLYKLPLGPGGALPDPSDVETLPLSGDFVFVPGAFNSNGIAATPNGEWLIIVNSALGALYLVDPDTGEATQIDLGGATLPFGDGLLLDGKDLYVMQNQLNTISIVRLSPDLTSGTVTRTITDPAFRVPATIAEFGSSIYAVNARFDAAAPPFSGAPLPDPPLDYEIVKVSKR
jgi:sugar lactone lactonase YvrE